MAMSNQQKPTYVDVIIALVRVTDKGSCLSYTLYTHRCAAEQYFVNEVIQFLANVNSRSRSLYAIARPSVVCL